MTFVSPLFLWALLAMAVPIVIHLFNFRKYQKVYFSNVKFLKELQQESKSRSRLKELLILLCRCLAIACLVLAFCQPLIYDDKKSGSRAGEAAVSIYLDNSFSMENVNKQGPLLQVAKTQAKEIMMAYHNAARFQIITNDFEGKHQHFFSKEDALNVLEDVKISSAVRSLSDVLKRQTHLLSTLNLPNKKIIVLSDGQKSTFDIEAAEPDSSVSTLLLPLKANQVNNVYIDSCWFESPLQQKGFIQKLHARLVNQGSSDIEVGTARLEVNQQQVAIASFSLEAGSDTEVLFTFENKKAGFNYGSVKIEDYPINFDDQLFFSFNAEPHVRVTLVNGREQNGVNAFSSLFIGDSLFLFREFSEQVIDYGAFKTSDIIVLNQLQQLSSGLAGELKKFTEQGGAIVIVPHEGAGQDTYTQTLAALQLPAIVELDTTVLRTEKIDLLNGFYAGVFEKIDERMNLPLVTKHFRLLKTSRLDFESILELQNGDVFLGLSKVNNAKVYLFTVPLTETCSNFGKHALFVPTLYQMSFSSLQSAPLFYHVSYPVTIPLKFDLTQNEQPPHLKQIGGTIDVIPELRVINNGMYLNTRGQISSPGFYEVVQNNTALLPLAFNYSRLESDLKTYSTDELQEIISKKGWNFMRLIDDTSGSISARVLFETEGKRLWKLFIFLTLLFIALEVALLRLLK